MNLILSVRNRFHDFNSSATGRRRNVMVRLNSWKPTLCLQSMKNETGRKEIDVKKKKLKGDRMIQGYF